MLRQQLIYPSYQHIRTNVTFENIGLVIKRIIKKTPFSTCACLRLSSNRKLRRLPNIT